MYPIKTYLDIADDTYTRGMGATLQERRDWARLEVRDSNTVGKDYLLLKCSFNAEKHAKWRSGGASIRLHKGQVKRLIRALQQFIADAEGGKDGSK